MALTTFSGPVKSDNGFLDSSFTTAERDAIVNPQAGLLIYNTDDNEYQVYNGSAWVVAFGGGPAPGQTFTAPTDFTQTFLANGGASMFLFAPSPALVTAVANSAAVGQTITIPVVGGSTFSATVTLSQDSGFAVLIDFTPGNPGVGGNVTSFTLS